MSAPRHARSRRMKHSRRMKAERTFPHSIPDEASRKEDPELRNRIGSLNPANPQFGASPGADR